MLQMMVKYLRFGKKRYALLLTVNFIKCAESS